MGLQNTYEGHYRESITSLEALIPVYEGVAGGEWTYTAQDPENEGHVTEFADNFDAAAGTEVSPEALNEAKEEIYRRAGIVTQAAVEVETVNA